MKKALALGLMVGVLAFGSAWEASAAPPGRYIVVLESSVSSAEDVAANHAARFGASVKRVYETALKGYAARMTAEQAARVSRSPRVAWVEVDGLLHATAQTIPTGVNRIEGDLSTQKAGDGIGSVTGPAVAVIDTGIDLDHPDLNVIAVGELLGRLPIQDELWKRGRRRQRPRHARGRDRGRQGQLPWRGRDGSGRAAGRCQGPQ